MGKPQLVMVHGLIGTLDYFDPASRIRRASVRCCELLGYGELRAPSAETLTLEAQADHLGRFVAGLGAGPVWLLGHSMGGAVALLLADRCPDLVRGLISVEGNFTLKDAFWSSRIVRKGPARWVKEYQALLADVPAALESWDIDPNPQRIRWMQQALLHQPPETVYAMSRALVAETSDPSYLETARRLVARKLPIHLLAGEKSAGAWDVPDFVRRAAGSFTVQRGAGHLMMLEEPDEFCRLVEALVAAG
jgi:pimeloyl-ACP methyl ester carboxylesterase